MTRGSYNHSYSTQYGNDEQDCKIIKHLGIHYKTENANFYITEKTDSGEIKGTWINKSAIVEHHKNSVTVKGWLRMTTITWGQ